VTSTSDDKEKDKLIKSLRDQIAALIGQKVELERRLAAAERSTALSTVDALATRTIKAVEQAQQDLAAGAAGSPYVVSSFQAEFRGLFAHQGEELALRLPLPQEPILPDAGGRLSLSFARTPVDDPQRRDLAAAGRGLMVLVEEAQARFDRWPLTEGAAVARGLVAVLTGLFAAQPLWLPGDLAEAARALGDLTAKLAKAITARISGVVFDELLAASQDLKALAGQLRAAPFTEPPALGRLAAAVRSLLGVFPLLSATAP
jgi:hypothetical protein